MARPCTLFNDCACPTCGAERLRVIQSYMRYASETEAGMERHRIVECPACGGRFEAHRERTGKARLVGMAG